jgi:3-oxoacyl-[acyl-carrier protein] reductase
MKQFEGKVSLITGADRGIGRALARRLASEGARLVLHSNNGEGLRKAIADEGWAEERVLASAHDVADSAAVEASVDAAIGRFGRIDQLVNVAGIAYPGGVLNTPREIWDRTVTTNLTGYYVACAAVLPHMKAAGDGYIVNMSSIWGTRAAAPGGGLAYSVSKWGVEGLTRGLAAEAGHWGVRVSGIVLDKVDTDFSEHMPVTLTAEQRARMLSVEDVAEVTVGLLSSSPRAHVASIELNAWLWR